jgi:2-polyprenyl-6-methoxyphenol hydroxylase-like FAD-dependent oxidoreductase
MSTPAARLAPDAGPVTAGHPEVLVVGAGPVGMFAALLLAGHGVRVQIVDEERRPAARSYALALHPLSLRLLSAAGVAGPLLEQGHRVDALSFYDGHRRHARLDLTTPGAEFPFALVLPQQILEGVLESELEERGIEVLWNHRVTALEWEAGEVLARIEHLEKGAATGSTSVVNPDFVIGADGHRSVVRDALGFTTAAAGPAETFAIFEFLASGAADREASVVLDDRGASVLWPLGRGRFRWSFQIDGWDGFVEPRFKSRLFAHLCEEPFPYLVRQQLERLLAERAPWFDARIGEIVWSMAARFERRLVERFGRGSVWLAGDAAHLASPVGVQSMNVGLREAHELAWRLAGVLRDGAPADTLQHYDRECHREWRQLLGLDAAPEPAPGASDWIRQRAARIAACLPASGEQQTALLAQLGLETGG